MATTIREPRPQAKRTQAGAHKVEVIREGTFLQVEVDGKAVQVYTDRSGEFILLGDRKHRIPA
jgi:hypothetical protein